MTDDSNRQKRVLFVDDERNILDGLKRMLRGQRKEWEMAFATGGHEALEELGRLPYDVIVSDMCMPGMDGATLLSHVQEQYPGTVRIVLSGHSETEASLRAAVVAHQFLSKPCDAATLREVVHRACGLQQLLSDESLQRTLGTIKSVPALPRVYNELVVLMADPESGAGDAAAIVQQDVAISAKILQLVNSSFFGIAREVVDIGQATAYLGMATLRDLTLSMEVFQTFETLPGGFSLESEQGHSTLTSRIAKQLLADNKRNSDMAFLAGMLHDIGGLILASSLTEEFEAIVKDCPPGTPMHEAEVRRMGVCHAEVGAYVLGLWGMPYPVIEAVANHHHPSRVPQESFGVLGAVHVANALAQEYGDPKFEEGSSQLDMEYLESMGLLPELEKWRVTAMEICGASVQGAG